MKTLLLLAAMLVGPAVLAQGVNTAVIDSTYTYNTDNVLTTFTRNYYNDDGKIYLVNTFDQALGQYRNGVWMDMPMRKRTYEYDSRGNVIIDKELHYDILDRVEGDYVTLSLTEYEYDELGNQTLYSRLQEMGDPPQLQKSYRWRKSFNMATGKQIFHLAELGVDNEWKAQQLQETTLFEDGNDHIQISLRADNNGNWMSGYRNENLGWRNNSSTGGIYQTWSRNLQDWENANRSEYEFDEQDNPVKWLVYLWDQSKQAYWHAQNDYYEYDDNRFRTFQRREKRTSEEAAWVDEYRTYSTLNEHGMSSSTIRQIWDPIEQKWHNNAKTEFGYDNQNRQVTYAQMNWNLATESWVGVSRSSTVYFKDNLVQHSLDESFSTQHQTWFGQREMISEYDHNDMLISETNKFSQNPETGKWMIAMKTQMQYDKYGYITQNKGFIWDAPSQDFKPGVTSEYINDLYGNRKQERIISAEQINESTTKGFATYQLNLHIKNGTTPVQDAKLTFNGHTLTSDEHGLITTFATTGPDMLIDYSLEKEGHISKQGSLEIDQHISETILLAENGIQTYTVAVEVSRGGEIIENAQVYLSGYGIMLTNAEGVALFSGVISGNNLVFYVAYAGLYYEGSISVSNQNQSIQVDLGTVNINEPTLDAISVFPNPARGVVTIDLMQIPTALVEIVSMDGRTEFSERFGSGLHPVDVSHLHQGYYFIRISNGYYQITKKLQVY